MSHVYYLKDYCSLLLYQEGNYCRLCTAVTSLNMKQSIVVYQSSRHHTKQERRKPSLTKQTEMCAKAAEKIGKNSRGYCSIIESIHSVEEVRRASEKNSGVVPSALKSKREAQCSD